MKNLGCTKEKWKVFYTKPGRISYVCNWGYDGQSCICGEYSKPIHVKDQPIILDGCETHNEVFEGHFEFQIMPQR
jgi:hypothetical protein